jgi:osmotically-inducible protein OsmY
MTLSAASHAMDRPNDEVISYWIKKALREDPRVDAADVQVETHDGIVTLSGSTRNVIEKKYAVLESKKIQGVRGVINKLQVAPSGRFDSDISQDIQQRLIFNAVIDSYGPYGLGVTVQDANVTLTGEVDSWEEYQEAELVAGEVRGVKSVKNDLVVNYHSHRPDREIEMDVISAIYRDEYLTGLPIQVSVDNGRVTLTGEAGNAYQKERAGDDAHFVDNVEKVDNKIAVKWWKEKGSRAEMPLPTDDQLQQSVHDELYQDLRIDPIGIAVDASYGHITLSGTVPNYPQKLLAERDAREVVGVAWVNNILSVQSKRRDDRGIRHDIETAINSDFSLNGQDIHVRVANSVVTLSGNVNEYHEKFHAADVAGKVLGVNDVVNNIVVNLFPKYTDTALTTRIKDRLASNWETSWISDRINVEVENGVVTLTGEVVTWSERDEAGRVSALTDGVFSVNNLLTVANVPYPWGETYDSWPHIP